MGGLIIVLSLVLVAIILIQIGRINDLAIRMRGEEEAQEATNDRNAKFGLLFMVGFLIFVIVSFMQYKNKMFGYGPHTSASEHGVSLDNLFNVTMAVTGIVFFITHILLFWYAYKYRGRKGHKAKFIPHDNRLEIIWMVIPSIVMTFLVISGLTVWNKVMADIPEGAVPGEDYIEIEATGYQFAWMLRYPGKDYLLGARDFREIKPGFNEAGQLWTDEKNHDDFFSDTLMLPKGKTIRVRIVGRDVLHNFYLPHFRVKMDAVPGMPTYFVFTPQTTTEEYRDRLSQYPEWTVPADPTDPDNKNEKWEEFEYELACAELCGNGHFSMRKIVKVVEQEEFDAWYNFKQSFYDSSIKGTDDDPYKEENTPEETPTEEIPEGELETEGTLTQNIN